MQLDEITTRIDRAFGEELPVSRQPLEESDLKTLEHVFGDDSFQHYLQDQVCRQIIRDYLTNAVLLGHLSPVDLESFADQVKTLEGRSLLSLHMLMTSVEDAATLPAAGVSASLKPLKPPVPDRCGQPSLSLVPK